MTDLIRCTKTRKLDTAEHGTTDFDLLDKRGRAIGYAWKITAVTLREIPDAEVKDYCAYYRYPVSEIGERFELSFSVTRNGRAFGASQGCPLFPTIEAARAAAQEKAASARKRYAAKPQADR